MEHTNTGEKTRMVCGGFNYCLWSKLMVALLSLPLVGSLVASFFTEPVWQFAAASYAGGLMVWAAAKIDALPFLQRKFRKTRCLSD